MKVINLYGGPGIGKSTLAAELFATMKTQGYRVELVTEFAKDLTYGEDFFKLKDQLFVTAEQNHRLLRLEGKTDYVITDSPLLLGLVYYLNNISNNAYENLVCSLYNSYDNINFNLIRNLDIPYQEYGRVQLLHEAVEKDKEINLMLCKNNISYYEIKRGSNSVKIIFNIIKELENE